MTESDRLRETILKLRAMLRELHVTPEAARKEARTGPAEARAEEMRRRPKKGS